MSEQDKTRYTKAEVLEKINASYQALEAAIDNLTEEQLDRTDEAGWKVKDHLAHIAAWELGVAEHLAGGDRFGAMQIEHPRGRPVDEVNDEVYRNNAHLTYQAALEKMRAAHRRFLQVFEGLSDDDLYRPYRSFLPEGERGPSDPVMNWIEGDTYAHYEEHIEWLEKLTG
jgi:hypothetical protein